METTSAMEGREKSLPTRQFLAENIYNMDETGALVSVLNFLKVIGHVSYVTSVPA
jgi:hypothetical protein